MRRIAYVDHSYHQKTKSNEFLRAFLKEIGQVDSYWDDSWSTGIAADWTSLNRTDYSLVIFFQVIPPVESLDKLTCRSILLVPMYDSVGDASLEYWVPFRRYAFLSFSDKTHRSLTRLGISSFRLQFFPNPEEFTLVGGGNSNKVFFWERSQDVSVATVQYWFSNYPQMKFHHHGSPDPGTGISSITPLPSDWGTSKWFDTQEAYGEVVETCNVYVAPRKREGIGMSFLEAMARGMTVVGWNNATLSEYVIDGENGVLLTVGEAVKPGVDWNGLGKAARKSIEEGYLRYTERVGLLKGWVRSLIQSPPKPRPTMQFYLTCASSLSRSSLRLLKRQLLSLRNGRT